MRNLTRELSRKKTFLLFNEKSRSCVMFVRWNLNFLCGNMFISWDDKATNTNRINFILSSDGKQSRRWCNESRVSFTPQTTFGSTFVRSDVQKNKRQTRSNRKSTIENRTVFCVLSLAFTRNQQALLRFSSPCSLVNSKHYKGEAIGIGKFERNFDAFFYVQRFISIRLSLGLSGFYARKLRH